MASSLWWCYECARCCQRASHYLQGSEQALSVFCCYVGGWETPDVCHLLLVGGRLTVSYHYVALSALEPQTSSLSSYHLSELFFDWPLNYFHGLSLYLVERSGERWVYAILFRPKASLYFDLFVSFYLEWISCRQAYSWMWLFKSNQTIFVF